MPLSPTAPKLAGMDPFILIVEDEPDIQRLLELNLQRLGLRARCAGSGSAAWELLRAGPPPDLVLLDLMLPDLSGLELCRRIRADARLAHVPVVMLTARGDEIDRVVGLSVGADDYVAKPFHTRELMLRIQAILRRTRAPAPERPELTVGPLTVDLRSGRAAVDGEPVPLTPQEQRILRALGQRRGRVCTREDLLDLAWDGEADATVAAVESSVKRLRRKLGQAAEVVETLRGVGYRLREAAA